MRRGYWKWNKLAIGVLLPLLMIFSCFSLDVYADEVSIEQMPTGYSEAVDIIDDATDVGLPQGIYSDNVDETAEAIEQMSGAEYLLNFISETVGAELGSSLKLFAKLCGLLLMAAVFGAIRTSFGSDALSGAVRFCTSSAIFAAIIYIQIDHLQGVQVYFERLSTLMNSIIPITGTVWAMGGNVTTASVGTSTFYIFLTVCENLCARTVMPVCCFCTAISLCSALSPDIGLGGFSGAIKKIYTFTIGLIMTVLVASLGAQTTLSAAADSTTARAARTVSSAVIPIVGGAVGDTLRTVAAGVGYLKSVVGIGGIIFVILLVLPVLLSLIMTRLAFLLATGVADMLGCDTERRLISELGGIYGCMIAAVAMSAVMFILGLNIFVKTVVAVG